MADRTGTSPRRYIYQGRTVPYITTWSTELRHARPLVVRRGRDGGEYLGYQDETRYDRDTWGALWVRQGIARGKGAPEWAAVHALRQRRAMYDLLCQVCGATTLDGVSEQQLYLLHAAGGRQIEEGERTASPPVHPACAVEAIEACPALRAGGYVAAWVRDSLPWGVVGMLHDWRDPTSFSPAKVAFGSSGIRWMVAHSKIVTLEGVTPVSPDELCDLAAPTP
ncbi:MULTISPECIES: hypothetical protein [Streptomycetaceae]|uniref:Uncharacterized protein n=1 Tax=Streptantibioticus cattleyicolor (strain ATCC 35852 / DSM 46488 / JCM 4925 / NBRC 14057 / NRRL 8057) TaxID=1003195 RepID=F8JYR6_STREN|nr:MULTISPECIES: hypothetical protein [Streptomycetaceae]AEW93898.1 hypothetical protein SCATT_15270 [Streptantibioticus cattleyicolor NRRL 8057 = DSM 46488]MYS58578.1 hypothetical protein [Streptomyces sp. SID5468]CCB74245.1 conserved protein of unknown function [Streptantibioticus cattleyicolor NRRL 8057 = DSM 46488]